MNLLFKLRLKSVEEFRRLAETDDLFGRHLHHNLLKAIRDFLACIALQYYLMIFDNHIPQPLFTVGQVRPMIAMLNLYYLIEQRP